MVVKCQRVATLFPLNKCSFAADITHVGGFNLAVVHCAAAPAAKQCKAHLGAKLVLQCSAL